jgi:hypothetical protein
MPVSTAEQYNRAVRRFEAGEYAGAATLLAGIVEQGGVGAELLPLGSTAARGGNRPGHPRRTRTCCWAASGRGRARGVAAALAGRASRFAGGGQGGGLVRQPRLAESPAPGGEVLGRAGPFPVVDGSDGGVGAQCG